MGDEINKLQSAVLTLGEQILTLEDNLAKIEAAVGVLKLVVATNLFPTDDPIDVAKQLRIAEKKFLETKGESDERERTLKVLQSLRQWKRTGGPLAES